MAIQRYEPNSLLQRFSNEIENMFDRDWRGYGDFPALTTSQWIPSVDVEETADEYRIAADVPGLNAEDIDVTFENGVLTLKGERNSERTTEANGARHVERSFGTFVRRFSLPDTADADNIDARVDKGVLHLTIKKKAESKPRKIEVKS